MFSYVEFTKQILNASKVDLELADRCYEKQISIEGIPIINSLVGKDKKTVSFELDISKFVGEFEKLTPFIFYSERYLDITTIAITSQYLTVSMSKTYPYTDILRLVTTDYANGHFYVKFAINDGGLKLLKAAIETHCIEYFDAATYTI